MHTLVIIIYEACCCWVHFSFLSFLTYLQTMKEVPCTLVDKQSHFPSGGYGGGWREGVEGGYQRGGCLWNPVFPASHKQSSKLSYFANAFTSKDSILQRFEILKHLNTSTHHGYFSPLWVAWIVKLHCYTRIIFGFSTLLYPVFVDRINTYKESMVNTENI